MIPFNYFRALFPRWSFYDQVAYHFELEFKVFGSADWHPISFTQPRSLFTLFLNSNCNLAMASINIIEHFATEVQSQTDFDAHQLTSFKLLTSLLKAKLTDFELPTNSVQFKIVAAQCEKKETIYFSNVLNLDEL